MMSIGLCMPKYILPDGNENSQIGRETIKGIKLTILLVKIRLTQANEAYKQTNKSKSRKCIGGMYILSIGQDIIQEVSARSCQWKIVSVKTIVQAAKSQQIVKSICTTQLKTYGNRILAVRKQPPLNLKNPIFSSEFAFT